MKHPVTRTLIVIFCLTVNIISWAQNIVISTEEKQTVYFNVFNKLNVGLSDYSVKDLILKSTNGEISHIDNKYFFKPASYPEAKINCFIMNSDRTDTILISSIDFKVVRIPIPKIEYSPTQPHSGGPIWLTTHGKLNLTYNIHRKDLNLDSLSRIISFDISMKDQSAKIDTVYKVSGSRIPPEFIKQLKRCHKNAEVEFFNIRIQTDWENPSEYFYDKYFKGEDNIYRDRLVFKIF